MLEAELNTATFHGDKAFSQVSEQLGVGRYKFPLIADSVPAARWVDDLWLSVPENAELLGEAEEACEKSMTNPQKALNLIARVLKTNIKRDEKIKCTLFYAAIMLSSGQPEQACTDANEALRHCNNDFL